MLISGTVVWLYLHYSTSRPGVANSHKPASKKSKGKKSQVGNTPEQSSTLNKTHLTFKVEPVVVPFPSVVPGDFTPAVTGSVDEVVTKQKQGKRKKANGAAPNTNVQNQQSSGSHSSAQIPKARHPVIPPTEARQLEPHVKLPSSDTDSSWTRVEPQKQKSERLNSKANARAASQQLGVSTDFTSSDFGPSTTGDSPSVGRTDERSDGNPDADPAQGDDDQRTLAEKLLPQRKKTNVEDMLEHSDYPSLARVMRVQPRADERPAAGFSWQDYEDVEGTASNEADDDEGKWGVVKGKSRSKPTRTNPILSPPSVQQAPETLTKRQRQNANKRAAEKAAKAESDTIQQARLAQHRRELERAKIMEQVSRKGGRKTPGGGMQASVDSQGHMVFD
ncbi:hypothetical protein BJ138DRAFT_1065661 [Hygrophoropsis aurantiaca]|uniref:Uncharacterized protein n=1 Tax=Hygrophoropsis aurantiaca TaxID=72124 RepID=A0ACB8AA78_9AGAM|nr:hypothetical protein BJ138DRAFT_1065661 [Hygrophoropsis aurantiaca]